MHETAKLILLNAVKAAVRLPPKTTVTEWCEANLFLTSLQTDTPGNFSTRLTPYSRDILEDFRNPDVEAETLCFGAQTAKTMTMMAGVTWSLVNNPRPSLWVMPNKDLAMAFSETRLQPLFAECGELMKRKHNDRHKYKKMQMEFMGAVLTLIGSNSPANLASRPAGLLVMDEVDKFAESTKKEANALELAEMRTRTFANPKIFRTSTPSVMEAGIWRSFLAGSMHRFFLPCPKCEQQILLALNPEKSALPRTGKEATLMWDPRAKGPNGWDYDIVERTTYYECPHCKHETQDRHKTSMLRKGIWIPTNPNGETRHVSRHLPSMYAPWRKSSWGRMAVEFLQAQGSLEGLKGFINGSLAEPDMGQWEGGSSGRKERIVSVPEPLVKTVKILTADRQIDHHWYSCREFAPGGHSRLIEWGRCGTTDDLEDIRKRLNVNADLTGIDSGFEASTVYAECARFGWFAIRGDDRESFPERDKNGKRFEVPYIVRQFDPFIGTTNQGRTKIAELRWSNPTIKDILFRLRDSETAPVRWEVPETIVDEEYWRHMDGEYKGRDFNPRTGRVIYTYKKRSRHWPNHILDCECMAIAVAIKIGMLKTKGM
jgi:hypothetical protein